MTDPSAVAVLDTLSEADIAAALATPHRPVLPLPEDDHTLSSPRQAAVLVPFVRTAAGWEILFIRRAQSPRDRHSGEVAFPGGMWEPTDASLERTALREAQEEIGLPAAAVRVLGALPPHFSVAGIEITPIVGTADWPCELCLQRAEVARVFSIPLTWLATPANFSLVDIPAGRGRSVSYRIFAGERLWGATARVTLSLVSRLLHHCGLPLPLDEHGHEKDH